MPPTQRQHSVASGAQVQVSIVLPHGLETALHQVMLLDDLADVRTLAELQRLRPRVWHFGRCAQQSLALVRAVAEGEDVLDLRGVVQIRPVEPIQLGLKRADLPVQRQWRRGTLVGRASRDHPDRLQERCEHRHELPAAQFDPAPLGVGDQDDRAVLLREPQGLDRTGRRLAQKLHLPGPDRRAVVQAQVLGVDPARRQDGVVVVEDEQGLLLRKTHLLVARCRRRRRGPGRLSALRAACVHRWRLSDLRRCHLDVVVVQARPQLWGRLLIMLLKHLRDVVLHDDVATVGLRDCGRCRGLLLRGLAIRLVVAPVGPLVSTVEAARSHLTAGCHAV
mmetsp:Transcript_155899/g.499824  ORF Transcript_155899/g.499824 Transcript_155899/m.499824 type:complete len:335 (+) Transcript_155899:178-1182(+)